MPRIFISPVTFGVDPTGNHLNMMSADELERYRVENLGKEEPMMAETGPSLPCYHCGATVDAYDAHAATMTRTGTFKLWTHGQAAYYARHETKTTPLLVYLCQSCTQALHLDLAQDNDTVR